ncbi:DUF2922 domain-containing protein [Bacillus salacetis]|uniref:DUF2922 domain-containing protein n=1 Tax=Bacillus salacetis TaxID=2315464 RepID=UPI003BA25AFD
MAKTLELQFLTQFGKTARVSVDEPIEPVDPVQVKQVMDTIIATNVFQSNTGALVSAEGARVVERNVTEYEV